MKVEITKEQYLTYIEKVSEKIASEKNYITELDSITGDGDHWVNMNMGFQKLISSKSDLEQLSFNQMFKKIGMLIMSTVGGSSGVLYGSAYIKAASEIGDAEIIDLALLLKVFEAKLNGIMERGNAKPGDKTMIDSLYRGVEKFKEAISANKSDKEVLMAFKEGAQQGMQDTKEMEAAKGRAYYQTNKGVGHLDPGAVTMYYQIEALVDFLLTS
ncbi:MAG: dihydroxyacetone kinase subunit L [Dethiosulfatibacter sp.]|nr:dihydroxyacetone kinase subunit L [Dethiosulfatibacter sp.]